MTRICFETVSPVILVRLRRVGSATAPWCPASLGFRFPNPRRLLLPARVCCPTLRRAASQARTQPPRPPPRRSGLVRPSRGSQRYSSLGRACGRWLAPPGLCATPASRSLPKGYREPVLLRPCLFRHALPSCGYASPRTRLSLGRADLLLPRDEDR